MVLTDSSVEMAAGADGEDLTQDELGVDVARVLQATAGARGGQDWTGRQGEGWVQSLSVHLDTVDGELSLIVSGFWYTESVGLNGTLMVRPKGCGVDQRTGTGTRNQ